MSPSTRFHMMLLVGAASLLPLSTNAFGVGPALLVSASPSKSQRKWRLPFSVAAPPEVKVASSTPPSWDDLSAMTDETAIEEEEEEPVLTLYRDTNGWCPFCERVWLVVRAKKIPYRESLVSLQNKPDWYKELVPTGLVPAVLFHNPDKEKPERKIVWESADIIKALDESFPSSPRMVLDTPEYKEAEEMHNDLQTAGFGFVYAGRNASLTEDDKLERRKTFEAELDKLDASLAANGGLFRLGAEFCAIDALMVPTMERWRFQLPITAEIDILENRPSIQKWFDAMESFEPYAGRVAGDQYSWTATASTFLRYFGGGEDKPEIAAAIERGDAAATKLCQSFADGIPADLEATKMYAIEAAKKLVSNHEAIVKDCTNQDPKSQKDLARASNEDVADAVLRHVASVLLSSSITETATTGALVEIAPENVAEASLAAKTVASRLCVPRDMSAPAAAYLRGVLTVVADRLVE